jgi:hypothetical protein
MINSILHEQLELLNKDYLKLRDFIIEVSATCTDKNIVLKANELLNSPISRPNEPA